MDKSSFELEVEVVVLAELFVTAVLLITFDMLRTFFSLPSELLNV